jgi:hypothetical protein
VLRRGDLGDAHCGTDGTGLVLDEADEKFVPWDDSVCTIEEEDDVEAEDAVVSRDTLGPGVSRVEVVLDQVSDGWLTTRLLTEAVNLCWFIPAVPESMVFTRALLLLLLLLWCCDRSCGLSPLDLVPWRDWRDCKCPSSVSPCVFSARVLSVRV